MTMAGTAAGTATAPSNVPVAAGKNDWHLYTGKEVETRRGVGASSVWTEISSEKRFLTRPGQKSISGGQKSQLM